MRVMVVDDDPWLADLLKQLVLSKRPAAEVDCYGDVQSAYAGWQSSKYRLVLADWNLPGDSGLSLLQLIRKQDKETPLVMITGRSDRDSVLAARPLAISAYITKPFEVPKVLECLERLLPQDSTPKPEEHGHEDLDSFLANRSTAELDLPMLARVKERLMLIRDGVPLDFRELTEDWQHDPALCAYLISAANSALYGGVGQSCTSLADALKRLGGHTSLNLAIGLALRQACRQEEPLLAIFLQEHLEASERMAEKVVQLARQCGVEHGALQVAALLHRMGELCVLLQAQVWVERGNPLDDNAVVQAVDRYARTFAIALKAHWGLPMALRELIGAAYALPQVQVHREQALMRLAAALCGNEPAATIERLKRLAGVD
ncbi:HDOD domain-containing protein [Pseudomonas sp. CAU 1711]|uniref:HDOD domain-containing protein n=1 Tax=Pseudomonas sp. CAU 1711 TaxID=3140356 RepID=UPI003260AA9B